MRLYPLNDEIKMEQLLYRSPLARDVFLLYCQTMFARVHILASSPRGILSQHPTPRVAQSCTYIILVVPHLFVILFQKSSNGACGWRGGVTHAHTLRWSEKTDPVLKFKRWAMARGYRAHPPYEDRDDFFPIFYSKLISHMKMLDTGLLIQKYKYTYICIYQWCNWDDDTMMQFTIKRENITNTQTEALSYFFSITIEHFLWGITSQWVSISAIGSGEETIEIASKQTTQRDPWMER